MSYKLLDPSKRKLRGALFGCGHIAAYHLKAWSQIENVEIISLANRTRSKAEALGREYGIPSPHIYSDHRELLENEKLDFVDIATAPDVHRRQVEDAADKAVHVLCQKPFAPTLEDAQAMIAACERAGILFSINDNWRWRSWYREIKTLLAAGTIGKPHYARFVRHSNITLPLADGGLPALFINQSYTQEMDRLIVYEWGIHLLDVTRFLFGEIHNIHARMDRISSICKGEDRALLTMEVGGVVCLIDISWSSINVETHTSQLEQVTIEGSQGSLELLPNANDSLRICSPEGAIERPAFECSPQEAYQASYTSAQRHFSECLREGKIPETEAHDNLRTLQAVFAAYESARNQKVVFLNDR